MSHESSKLLNSDNNALKESLSKPQELITDELERQMS